MSNSRATLLALSLLAVVPIFAGCAASGTQESTGQYIDDSAITTKVKAKLLQDSVTSALHISVDTNRGRVQLSGDVKNEEARKRAEELAKQVPGVTGVTNDIQVK